jgi:hypothetical protein
MRRVRDAGNDLDDDGEEEDPEEGVVVRRVRDADTDDDLERDMDAEEGAVWRVGDTADLERLDNEMDGMDFEFAVKYGDDDGVK